MTRYRWLVDRPWFRVYCYREDGTGVGIRTRKHYWFLRNDPMTPPVYSEAHKINCNWWQIGRWRLTHRWGYSSD